ncbi:MAG: hypothetical protein IIX51_05285 [Methanocorpusculum sp.]|nr:hypothetical protein [Methanocorpusculum sp.]MEE1135332.1 hypothetical protein [Methanocorpusculum sp.]HJJ73140.1 hypothetical protein [Methanocorpusculum sp.]HJJ77642.1 hypothetical protein [Methanocorpusculum sp.]
MGLYQFPVTRRFNRYMGRLVSGSKKVRSLLSDGQIISAERRYNKLCMDYAECRVLVKRRAQEIEMRRQFADGVSEVQKIREAFLEFYSLAEEFKVDIVRQRCETLHFLDELESLFASKV